MVVFEISGSHRVAAEFRGPTQTKNVESLDVVASTWIGRDLTRRD